MEQFQRRRDTSSHQSNLRDGLRDFTRRNFDRLKRSDSQQNIQKRCEHLLPYIDRYEQLTGCPDGHIKRIIEGLKTHAERRGVNNRLIENFGELEKRVYQANIRERCDNLRLLAHLSKQFLGRSQESFEKEIKYVEQIIENSNNVSKSFKRLASQLQIYEERMYTEDVAKKLDDEISERIERIDKKLDDPNFPYFGKSQKEQIKGLIEKINDKRSPIRDGVLHELQKPDNNLKVTNIVYPIKMHNNKLKALALLGYYVDKYAEANQKLDKHYNQLFRFGKECEHIPNKCQEIIGCTPQELIVQLKIADRQRRLANAEVFKKPNDWIEEFKENMFKSQTHLQLENVENVRKEFEKWSKKWSKDVQKVFKAGDALEMHLHLQSTADELDKQSSPITGIISHSIFKEHLSYPYIKDDLADENAP